MANHMLAFAESSIGLDRCQRVREIAPLEGEVPPGAREGRNSFGDEGYSVESVPSGEACLERLTRSAVDLILLDVWLPGMDGLEATRAIREVVPARTMTAQTAAKI